MHPACADTMVSGADVVDERIVELWTRNNESFNDMTWDTYDLDMYTGVFPALQKHV